VVICALVCVACGSKQSVDSGGFTAAQRTVAQTALDRLQGTAIPTRVVAISLQTRQAPRICSLVPQLGAPGTFKLVVAWKPSGPGTKFVPQSVLEATIGTSVRDDRFQVTTFGGNVPEPPRLQATLVRAVESKPAEECEILENGHLQLVPGQ
jgi:hypothetical protein